MICVCCCHSHCCCQPPREAPIPTSIVYHSNSSPKLDVRSFMETDTSSLDDVKSILTRYNPELCKYFCGSKTEQSVAPLRRQQPPVQNRQFIERQELISKEPAPKEQANIPAKPQPPAQDVKPQQSPEGKEILVEDDNELQYRRPKQQSEADRIAEELARREGSTREFPDTKFRRYYNKQCVQNYGGVNINPVKGGVYHGDYMKTHSVNPHTVGNRPEHYQTYKGALQHAKHQGRDKDQRKKQLQREFQRKTSSSQSQYNGHCQQKEDKHIYDQHDDKHRSKHKRTRVHEQDRNIEQRQHENHSQAASSSNLSKKILPTPKGRVKLPQTVPSKPQPNEKPEAAEIAQPSQPKIMKVVELRCTETQTQQKQEPSQLNKEAYRRSVVPEPQAKLSKPEREQNNPPQPKGNNHKSPNQPMRRITPMAPSQQPVDQVGRQDRNIDQPHVCCQECDHKQCQCLRQMKLEILERAQRNPDLAQRLISYARHQNLYRNYTFELDSLNRYPCHKNQFEKYYYDWPRYKLDPKNYKCSAQGCLEQVPYAGKGMLNGHYEYEPHHP